MSRILATLRKEMISYFFSPVAYIIAVVFYLFRGSDVYELVHTAAIYHFDTATFASQYAFKGQSAYVFFLLVPPILTMRCFAEERRTGSLEVLMTAPVRDVEVVVGKWLAALAFFALLWLPTLPILMLLSGDWALGESFAYGPVLSAYLGLGLLGSMLLSLGLFTSSLTDNMLLASLTAMIGSFSFLYAPRLLHAPVEAIFGDHYIGQVLLEQTNIPDHLMNWFGRGQIDTSKIVFYLAGTCFFLFLTVRSLESRKWR